MKKHIFILLFLIHFVTTTLPGADLVRVLPLTHDILVAFFDEGHIDYFGIHEDRYSGNKVYYKEFDLQKGVDINSYTLKSRDDEHYSEPVNPVNLGRKSKGADFHNLYDPNNPKVIHHHWIYLQLPFPLQRGKTYTLYLNDFASNVNEYTFIYNESQLRSPAIHVNQIGFVPDAVKYAYLSHFMGDFNNADHQNGALNLDDFAGTPFHLVRTSDDSVVFTGTPALQREKDAVDFTRDDFENPNMTRADVWECDFSAYSVPGEYKIVVENIGCSYPFGISPDIYRELYYYTSRAMFTQRQGIIQEIEPGFNYPRDHRTEDGIEMRYFPDLSDEHEFDPEGGVGTVKGVWGWYHDAGDWDGYSHHYRVPMTLLALYDLAPENFGDGDVNPTYKSSKTDPWISEGSNGIPDVLDEAMWLIRFYKRAQDSLKSLGYTDGGVPGYVGVDAGADGGKPSWEDTRVLSLQGGNSVTMAYRYAASAAWLAICLDKFNGGTQHPDSPGWINEAENSYAWAVAQNRDTEEEVNRAKMEAAAALYRYTATTGYQNDFRTCKAGNSGWGEQLWFSINPWHYAATLFTKIPDDHPGLDTNLKQACISDIVSHADQELVFTANERGFRYGLDKNILFMLGTFSTPRTFLTAAAYELTGEKKYLDACYSIADYCLGGNQMDMVKISGLGENPERQPFHPDSWYLTDYNSPVYTNPILPGYVIYEMHKTGDWMAGVEWTWIGDEDFSRSTAYPPLSDFPDSETRFWNRNSIAGSEFTIHQSLDQAIFAYGYLCGNYTGPYTPNTRPTVALDLPDNMTVNSDTTLTLTVTASEDARRVGYYYDWHFIGESTDKENGFAFDWNLSLYKNIIGKKRLTAKAFDDRGLESKPTEEGEKSIRVKRTSSVSDPGDPGRSFNYKLDNNYPNPFNPSTYIGYELAEDCNVSLKVYAVGGQEVTTLVDAFNRAGQKNVIWDGTNQRGRYVPSGVYFLKLNTSSGYQEIQKMLLVK